MRLIFKLLAVLFKGNRKFVLMQLSCLVPTLLCLLFIKTYSDSISGLDRIPDEQAMLILSAYSENEANSFLQTITAALLVNEFRNRSSSGTAYNPSQELLVNTVSYDEAIASISIRGLHLANFEQDVSLIQGRLPNTSSNEVVLGKALAEALQKTLGEDIEIGGHQWTITGLFNADHPVRDMEAWTSIEAMWNTFTMYGAISSIRLKVTSEEKETLKTLIDDRYPSMRLESETTLLKEKLRPLLEFLDIIQNTFFIVFVCLITISLTVISRISGYFRERFTAFLKLSNVANNDIRVLYIVEAFAITLMSFITTACIYQLFFADLTVSFSSSFLNLNFSLQPLDLKSLKYIIPMFFCFSIVLFAASSLKVLSKEDLI